MALEQRLSVRMSQRLIMTPSLQQAIKLLQMSKLELVDDQVVYRSPRAVSRRMGIQYPHAALWRRASGER
jgi:hypothetical protein